MFLSRVYKYLPVRPSLLCTYMRNCPHACISHWLNSEYVIAQSHIVCMHNASYTGKDHYSFFGNQKVAT